VKLTGKQLYDRRDPTRAEMLLVRAIHHLWLLRRKSAPTGSEERALDEGLETLFEAKRQVKAEIRAKGVESFKRWKRG
jgi:hypothetical protein